ncbi:hypothetical protein [Alienimonas californiensis]|uniref:Uncharacterized protein n=1 Tax=Alienimonas californiensis TaxID=2527989 RepID=A0A517P8C4_9PLAN|nr:hypothetical protein [Alienimonas californiensis]QDT15626.1 hypothetical protein CA12_17110 [Alienimonas californiensis]
MRKRTAAAGGAGIAGLLALGLMYLPDWEMGSLGVPSGGGTDVTDLTLDPTSPDAAEDVESAPIFNGAATPVTQEMVESGEAGGPNTVTGAMGGVVGDPTTADGPPLAVVDVLVDGGEYLVVQRFASDGLPIREGQSLSAVLNAASQAEGAPDGVKVRVSRTPNAIAGAATDLMDALRKNGFQEDEIDYRQRLVTDETPAPPGGVVAE